MLHLSHRRPFGAIIPKVVNQLESLFLLDHSENLSEDTLSLLENNRNLRSVHLRFVGDVALSLCSELPSRIPNVEQLIIRTENPMNLDGFLRLKKLKSFILDSNVCIAPSILANFFENFGAKNNRFKNLKSLSLFFVEPNSLDPNILGQICVNFLCQ